MANIVINEISQNYTYNIGNNSFATVAMPITACWGPGYFGIDNSDLDTTVFERFPATQAGMEAFVSAYRGPASNYRLMKDYSYQMAMTLLSAGYDVLVCRLCNGAMAETEFSGVISTRANNGTVNNTLSDSAKLTVKAKYPGTFGNNLVVNIAKRTGYNAATRTYDKSYWNAIVYIQDTTGVRTAVENLSFVIDVDNADDTYLHYLELESNYIQLDFAGKASAGTTVDDEFSGFAVEVKVKQPDGTEATELVPESQLAEGSDRPASSDDAATALKAALESAKARYGESDEANNCTYITKLASFFDKDGEPTEAAENFDKGEAELIAYREWLYTCVAGSADAAEDNSVLGLLTDKLAYNPQRIISPGWDDQDISAIDSEFDPESASDAKFVISPIHKKIMDVSYYSRCGTGLLDIPRSLPRDKVYNEDVENLGYAQELARYSPVGVNNLNVSLFSTHSALFTCWGQYTYVGTSRMATASPSFLALMIQRAMLLNQANQYEWALPVNRKHNLKIGKMDYKISKKLLDKWQTLEGVGVNCITQIPDMGTSLWGNSTLYEVPAATYQALANLSTRYLVNAVENIVYKCGISITFQYNNDQAYSNFYAGVSPILDTMKNVGAIDDYYIRMSADINGLDQVNANTVIGKVYLVINGVINDIIVDLIALPPGTDLNQFRAQ